MRDPLFSLHTTDDGAVALYLEEPNAIADLVTDVVGCVPIEDLENLQGANQRNLRDPGVPERLDYCRDALPDMAPLIAFMSQDEALNLAYDIIQTIKRHRIDFNIQKEFNGLKVVK